jgi:hypothetical protein
VKHYILRYTDLFYFIWNEKDLPQQWKESIIVPNYETGDKTDFKNYGGISLLSTAYKTLSYILLASLTSYVNEITGKYQRWFRRNRPIVDKIFYIRQVLRKHGSIMGRCISYSLNLRRPKTHDRSSLQYPG